MAETYAFLSVYVALLPAETGPLKFNSSPSLHQSCNKFGMRCKEWGYFFLTHRDTVLM